MYSRRRRGGEYMKKDLIISVLLTFCLTCILFIAVPTMSQETLEYDPWKDVNDDGKIDILDVTSLTGIYGAQGTPINKTELLFQLLTKIEQLNATITGLQSDISELEANLAVLSSTKLGRPDYDSGWLGPLADSQFFTLTHGLGTEEVLVYLIGKGTFIDFYGVHQIYYQDLSGSSYGAGWYGLNATQVRVGIRASGIWDYMRVLIWKIPQP
jgi:hypothetical protein